MSQVPSISETQFQKQVIQFAQLHGWRVAHFRPARVRRNGKDVYRTAIEGDTGYVDLTLARDGVVVHAELKSDTGTLSVDQIAWQVAIGKTACVWRPRDQDRIEAYLSRKEKPAVNGHRCKS